MKKLTTLALIAVIVMAFITSCEKKSAESDTPTQAPTQNYKFGFYNPSKKISKIYRVKNDTETLYEDWTWKDDQLQRVEKFDANGNSLDIRLTYNDEGRIVKILTQTSAFSRYSDIFKYNSKGLITHHYFTDRVGDTLKYKINCKNGKIKSVVGEGDNNKYSATYEWTGDNVTRIRAIELGDTIVYSYTYDNHINAEYGRMPMRTGMFSKNNMTSMSVLGSSSSEEGTYTYTYNEDGSVASYVFQPVGQKAMEFRIEYIE